MYFDSLTPPGASNAPLSAPQTAPPTGTPAPPAPSSDSGAMLAAPIPVWRGTDVAIIIGLTLVTFLVALLGSFVVLGVIAQAHGAPLPGPRELGDVRLVLVAQLVGYLCGFAFAQLWVQRMYGVRFWQAIQWHPLARSLVIRLLLAGVAVAVASQVLERLLPVPKHLPIDRMFTPVTAWPLAIYGVAIAPFFEEFIFRGLIFPSLRRTFSEGMTPEEARGWRPFLWLTALSVILVSAYLIAAEQVRGHPRDVALVITLAVAAGVGLLAGPILQALAAVFRWLSRLAFADGFAIATTGVLFGLIHTEQLGSAWSPVLILSLIGAVFTAARAYTGSLVASWLMHVAYNSTLFVLVFTATHGFRNFDQLAR